MKRLIVLVVVGTLSTFLIATVSAATEGTSDKPKQSQGIKNAKKAMPGKLELDKQVQKVREKGHQPLFGVLARLRSRRLMKRRFRTTTDRTRTGRLVSYRL